MAQITFPDVQLTEDEQEHLFALIHKGTHNARVITRARILSKLVKGLSHQEVCSALDVTLPTVLKTRRRLAEGGLAAALGERPRPGSKPKLNAKQAAMVTAIACSTAPDGHDHWRLAHARLQDCETRLCSVLQPRGRTPVAKKTN